MLNGVANLRPLCQSSSVFSLPNAPSLADLDWDEEQVEGDTTSFSYLGDSLVSASNVIVY